MLTTLPNLLTLSRIVAVPVVIGTFYLDAPLGQGSFDGPDQIGDPGGLEEVVGGAPSQALGDLVRLLRSPVVSRAEQAKAVAALCERAELAGLTRDFLGLVAKNRRLFAVPAMIEAYLKKLAERRGEVTAEVTVAQPLNEARQAALLEQLRRTVGARVVVDMRVDPRLLGGMIVKIGSRMVDASLNSRLQRLRLAMKATG